MVAGRKLPRLFTPSIVDATFITWMVAIPIAFTMRLLNSDGDAARHLAMGEHMLRHGLITRDLFSFTKAGSAYTPSEWLSQIAYALAHRAGGLAAVAIFAGLLIALAYALTVLFMVRNGTNPLVAYATGIVAAALGSVFWVARPHLMTFVALPLLLLMLEDRRGRRVWLIAPLFLLWANLHPGFVIGLACIALYLTGDLVELALASGEGEWKSRVKRHAAALALAVAGTLGNPRGVELYAHIAEVLGSDYLLGNSAEFARPDFHVWYGQLLLVTLVVVILLQMLRPARVRIPRLLVFLFMVAIAVYAQRNIPLFGIVALPLAAMELSGRFRPRHRLLRAAVAAEDAARPGRWAAIVAGVMLLLAFNHGRVGSTQLVHDRFDPGVFPVAAVEHAKRAGLHGRTFHMFMWGGYLLYAWPEQKVFIDGMTEFFGEAVLRDYLQILFVEPGWDAKMEAYGISLALLRAGSPLALTLEERGWRLVYGDRTAVMLERDP